MSTENPVPRRLQSDNGTIEGIIRPVWQRLNQKNEHFMHVIVGREGSGKSHTAIKICELIDPDFDASNVFFDPSDLLRYLRDGEYEEGQMLILDEAGASMGKRTWHDSGQVKLNQALQLIRNHNIGLIFTLPRLSELDSQAQGRLHSYYEIRSKNEGEYVVGGWYWLDPDRADITGDVYRKTPTRANDTKLKKIKFAPPTAQDVVTAYEERKQEFQKAFYDEAIDALADDDGDDDDALTPHDIADEIRDGKGVEAYISSNGPQEYIDKAQVSVEFDVGDRHAKKVKKILEQDVERDLL
jgi:ABC-type dipeptide/oligopeptide/nickel transport system ATPase component